MWVVHARSYTWRPADGVCIDKWGFEGTTPGPTLVAEPHQESELLVYNELPDNLYNPYVDPFNQLAWQQAIAPNRTHYTAFGPSPIEPPAPYDEAPYAQTQYELNPELTIHLHGGHQTPQNDGHPMDTFGPGQSHMYDYPNNQEATTLWYHDHAMDHTRGHVLNGLAGFYLVEDPATDAQVGLPTGTGCTSVPSTAPTAEQSPPYWPTPDPVPDDPEQPTACDDIPIMFQQVPAEMLSGQEFQPNAIAAPNDPANTPYRAVWTVNGTLAPYLTVTNKPYRFRFLNGNDEEPLQIWTTTDADDPTSYPSDAYLQQVGTDGGLMNSVVVADPPSQTRIRLFPAQRADVVIDFSKITTKTTIYLQSNSLQAFVGGTDTVVPDRPVRVRRQRRPDPRAPRQVRRRSDHPRRRPASIRPTGCYAAAQRRARSPGSRRRRPTASPCPNGRCCSASTERSAGTRSPPSTRSSSTHIRLWPSPSSTPPRSGT